MYKKLNKKYFKIWIIGISSVLLLTIVLEALQINNVKDNTGYFPIYILMSIPIYFIYTLWICDYNKKK